MRTAQPDTSAQVRNARCQLDEGQAYLLWKALDTRLHRIVAVKRLKARDRARFENDFIFGIMRGLHVRETAEPLAASPLSDDFRAPFRQVADHICQLTCGRARTSCDPRREPERTTNRVSRGTSRQAFGVRVRL